MPDRNGPLAYAHWVWLPVADLASKYDIVTGEGFPHRGFISLTTFTTGATISTYYWYVTLMLTLSSDARRDV
jgi:hypothetical protein